MWFLTVPNLAFVWPSLPLWGPSNIGFIKKRGHGDWELGEKNRNVEFVSWWPVSSCGLDGGAVARSGW